LAYRREAAAVGDGVGDAVVVEKRRRDVDLSARGKWPNGCGHVIPHVLSVEKERRHHDHVRRGRRAFVEHSLERRRDVGRLRLQVGVRHPPLRLLLQRLGERNCGIAFACFVVARAVSDDEHR
jgi:hypothetical protein